MRGSEVPREVFGVQAGYYWATDRAQSTTGPEIVWISGEWVFVVGTDDAYSLSEFDIGPRVKGQDAEEGSNQA